MSSIFVTDRSKYADQLKALQDEAEFLEMNPLFFGKSSMVRIHLRYDPGNLVIPEIIDEIEYTPFVRQVVLPYSQNREELELAILQKAINLENNPLSVGKDVVDEKNIIITYYMGSALPFYLHPREWELYSDYLNVRDEDELVSGDPLFEEALRRYPSRGVYKHPKFAVWFKERKSRKPEEALNYLNEMKEEEFFEFPQNLSDAMVEKIKREFELIELPDSEGRVVSPKPGLLLNESWVVDNLERIEKGNLPQVIINLEKYERGKRGVTEEDAIRAVEEVAEEEELPEMLSDLSLNYPYLWMRAPSVQVIDKVIQRI